MERVPIQKTLSSASSPDKIVINRGLGSGSPNGKLLDSLFGGIKFNFRSKRNCDSIKKSYCWI